MLQYIVLYVLTADAHVTAIAARQAPVSGTACADYAQAMTLELAGGKPRMIAAGCVDVRQLESHMRGQASMYACASVGGSPLKLRCNGEFYYMGDL